MEKRHGPATAALVRYKKRAAPVQTKLPERLAKLPKYSNKCSTQQDFERVLALFIAETCQSLCVVDHPRFRQLISVANARLELPNRRQLTQTMIPSLVADINEALVFPKIKDASGITLSFDLWMSRGHEDVFDIYAHFLDSEFHPHHVHVTMLRCDNTDGPSLGRQLTSVIDKFAMTKKIVACVSDGDGNMKTCMRVLDSSLPAHELTGMLPFKGMCMAHKLSLVFKHVLIPSLTQDLRHISFSNVRSTLQSCITWTKKSSKGASEWAKACTKAQLAVKKIPTPVNTRWASVVNTLSHMLKYRTAVETCFKAQSERLQSRLPSPRDWIVVSAVVSIMKPVMEALLYSQTRSFYLLSDMMVKLIELHQCLSATLGGLPDAPADSTDDNDATFDDELIKFKRHILVRIVLELNNILEFLRVYDAASGFMFAAIALDPRFKSLGKLTSYVGGSDNLRSIAEEYDAKFIVPLLASCSGMSAAQQPEAQVLLQDENSGIFGEGEVDDGPLDRVRWELNHFRKEKYTFGKSTKPIDCKDALKWLRDARTKYPVVCRLARIVLGVPSTQVDNEREFSVAGLVCSLRHSRLKVGTLSDLVHISLNTREEGVFEDFAGIDAKFCEELEEIGESAVLDDELNADLREGNEPIGSDSE